MQGHSSATLVVLGWLLMTPNRGVDGDWLRFAPIATWRQDTAYDTAKACEQAKEAKLQKTTTMAKEDFAEMSTLWLESKCVPTEVVYPRR